MSIPVVFLDKDGTLIKDVPHNVDVKAIQLAPYAISSLKRLKKEGFKFAIITNQSGIAMGYFDETDVLKVGRYLAGVFKQQGLDLLGFYFCPHHPQGKVNRYMHVCECRKPMPGLIMRAMEEHDIDLAQSWVIGDILDDIECGRRSGCNTIFLDNGNETQWIKNPLREPHVIVKNLKEAANYIVRVNHYEHMESG